MIFSMKIVEYGGNMKGKNFSINKMTKLEGQRSEKMFEDWVLNQIDHYTRVIKDIERKRTKELKGTLRVHTRKGHFYYYWQKKDDSGKYIQEYLGINKRQTAENLAKKDYRNKVYRIAEKNLAALQGFRDNFCRDGIKEIYENLGLARQQLVEPYGDEVSAVIKQWENEEYEAKANYQDGLQFETERGEFVRSKSEVIIANFLYQNRENLLYKYERPLQINVGEREITVYPDFTVLNLNTGKITYWEHAGRMDDENYASDFVWKHNRYMENGFVPGLDVIFTYETIAIPLNIKVVKLIIKELIGE